MRATTTHNRYVHEVYLCKRGGINQYRKINKRKNSSISSFPTTPNE